MTSDGSFQTLAVKARRRKSGWKGDSFRHPENRIGHVVSSDECQVLDENDKDKKGFPHILRKGLNLYAIEGSLRYCLWRIRRLSSTNVFLYPFRMYIGVILLFYVLTKTRSIRRNALGSRNIIRERFSGNDIYLRCYPSASNRLKFHRTYESDWKNQKPDYGDLRLTFIQVTDDNFHRKIKPEYNLLSGHVWLEDEYDKGQFDDEYYAFDDDEVRSLPFQEINRHCRKTASHKLNHQNCNLFHEIPFERGKYLGEGLYREAYLLQERFDAEIVMKVQRFHQNEFTIDHYELIRMDALVMERLTGSPRIADIYGHCATSVNAEFLPRELHHLIIPGMGLGEDMNDTMDVDPQNDLTITQKLDYALQMAEAIADLHGSDGGILVHDDLQVFQWLFTPDGRLKLNDFNRAESMLYDEDAGEYCKYHNGHIAGEFRAPEEIVDGLLSEKIDIFSYGNHIYSLLTGLWVYYEMKTLAAKPKMEKIKVGELPYVDPRYRNRNYIQDRLITLMEQCWKFNPDERIDIFSTVAYLRETKEEAINMGFYDEKVVDLHFQDWPISTFSSINK